MVVSDAINNIMGGMESTAGVRLHNHRRKLRQRFDIIKKLGQGTYGKVQLGINKETGQEVAIKTIKKSKIETEADLIRIRREIQIMSSVQHPNIIHIYEVFENREKMVLVMEYAAGGELYDFLSERKVLAETEARRIFRQIATAVFYCHKHNICHRDLKLENILLDEHGAAKIADFGLSNVFDEQRLLATFCGSPLYASPEIVRGTPYRGPEVDCWSLGVLLYTLVYGAMPFDGSNFKRLVKQISNGEYFEPKKPSPASGLIRAMLAVDPVERADIGAICSHRWINEGASHTCVELAEELAAQTPVRLDLLLSLAPAPVPAIPPGDATVPQAVARSQSVGSLMELDKARVVDLTQRRSSATGPPEQPGKDATKRKLEEGSSTDEANVGGAKRKERSRRRERSAERTSERKTRSVSRSKQTKPKTESKEPSEATAEAMPEVTPPPVEASPPESMDVDVDAKPAEQVSPEVKEDNSVPVKVEPPKEDGINEVKVTDDAKKVKVKRKKKVVEESKDDVSVIEPSQVVEKMTAEVKEDEKAVEEKTAEKVDEAKSAEPEAEKPKAVKKTGAIKKKLEPAKSTEKLDEAVPAKPMVRRRSKIFESEIQKFNNPELSSPTAEKPKKVFIPGVKVSDFKKAYERKSSVDLSSTTSVPNAVKTSPSRAAVETSPTRTAAEPEPATQVPRTDAKREEPVDVKPAAERAETKPATPVEPAAEKTATAAPIPVDMAKLKKNAIEIIGNAIAKPPKPLDKLKMKAKSPPDSPKGEAKDKVPEATKSPESSGKKLVKVQVGPNDVRNAVLQVSTPELVENFKFEERERKGEDLPQAAPKDEPGDRPKVSTKMEITLKSATLPRRKTSKAEIQLEAPPPKTEFRTQVKHTVQAVPQQLRTQRSEVAFPVVAAQAPACRSMSVEPDTAASKAKPKERIIPIQFARDPEERPPLQSQRSNQSVRSGSLSRQSTLDSDSGDTPASGADPIRKSPREFIIPIAVEGGGYVTPRAASLEPGAEKTETKPQRKPMRFARPLRMSSLLSESGASDDECFSPFSSLGRHDSAGIDDEFGSHMHQLRSSRPRRFPTERADSVSSGEDDDDDNFELLTAESLFSTLLSRVRNLTQRLNTDDNRPTFPNSRFMNHNFPSRSSFFSEPLSRRVSETSQFSRQSSRDRSCDRDSNNSSSTLRSGTSTTTLPRSTNSNASLPRSANSNVSLPRALSRNEATDSYYTPSLARRLQRANQDASLSRDSSHSSLPTSRDPSVRSVSRTGSLKSAERKSRLPSSYLHRSGSESYQPEGYNEGKARYSDGRYESPSKITADGRYDNGAKSYENASRSYSSVDSYESPSKSYESPSKSYESPSKSYESPSKSYESPLKSYDTTNRSPKPYENPSKPYDQSLETEDRYSSSSSLSGQSYLPANRRNLVANGTNSLPRRHTYRSTMSDTLDYNRGQDPREQEARPPLPNRRLPRSTSYLRQRALDIANIYSAPLASEPDDYSERMAEFRARRSVTPGYRSASVSRDTGGRESAYADRYRDLSRDRSVAPEAGGRETISEGIVRRQKSFDNIENKLRRPTSLDLRPTPERSVLGKLLGDKQDDKPPSPVKSPGRRVSRFLRPDFYDTAREDSAFVKVKEEEERAKLNGGSGSRQLNIANFLETNYADLERNIAKDLLAISEGVAKDNGGTVSKEIKERGLLKGGRENVSKDSSSKNGEKSKSLHDAEKKEKVVKKSSTKNAEAAKSKVNSVENADKINVSKEVPSKDGEAVKSPVKEEKIPLKESVPKEVSEKSSKSASKIGLEKNSTRENGVNEAPSKTKEAPKSIGSLETNGSRENASTVAVVRVDPASKSNESNKSKINSDVDKNAAREVLSKEVTPKTTEGPKATVKLEKNGSKENATKATGSKENLATKILQDEKSVAKEIVSKEIPAKIPEALKATVKLEKNGSKEIATKATGSKENLTPKSSQEEKNAAKDIVFKEISAKTTEEPKATVKLEKNGSKENAMKATGSKETLVSKILQDEKTVTKEMPAKTTEGLKATVKLEKNGSKENATKATGSKENLASKSSQDKIVTKKTVPKADKSAEQVKPKTSEVKNLENSDVKSSPNESSNVINNVSPKSLGNVASIPASVAAINSNGALNKEETKLAKKEDSNGATKLPAKIKLKKKVKKDLDSSPKGITEETMPKSDVTNRSKFLRTLDKTIDKLEETVKRPMRIVRESSLAPAEAEPPSISTVIKRAVSVDNCSAQHPEKSPNKIKRVIKSLKELATTPKTSLDSENSLLKRATSVDDLTNPSQTKTNQVSSMLGRFRKLEEPKKTSLLSRFRRTQSVYGGSTSDGVLALDGDVNKRASLGPDIFDNVEGLNEASCSVLVRRNSVKAVEEKANVDSDVSISATVKVVKVVKDVKSSGGVGKGKEELVNGKGLPVVSSRLGSGNQEITCGDQNFSADANRMLETPKESKLTSSSSNGVSRSEETNKQPDASVKTGPRVLEKLIKAKSANQARTPEEFNAFSNIPVSVNCAFSNSERAERSPDDTSAGTNGEPRDPRAGRSMESVTRDYRKRREGSEDDCESFDSCSVSLERTTSPLLPLLARLDGPTESTEARIRRKSFYSRFNDSKKQPVRKVSVPGSQDSKSSSFVDTEGNP